MTPELVERGGRLIVSTPLNHYWERWARIHDGRWDNDSKAWVFYADQRAAVEAALREIFGGEE